MRPLSIVCGILTLLASAYAQAPDPAPSTPVETLAMPAFEPTREEAVLEAFVDGVVTAHMRAHDIPGVSLSVVRDGRTLFAKGYGVADAAATRPVSGEETLFRIGSVSKTFIWTAVMMLVERGQINLEADVNTYLKGLQIPEKFNAPITMNDLMAHRAGFEDTLAVFTVVDEADRSLTEVLAAHMPARVFPPGARTSYSNWGSALAAKIVEDVSGKAFETFLNEEILSPLSMADTTLKGPARLAPPMREKLSDPLQSTHGWPADSEPMQIGPYAPAGGMSSSAADMARWMAFHLGGGELDGVRLMTPATHQRMLRRAFRDRMAGADLAHGFVTFPIGGYDAFGHAGATNAFYTNMMMIPALNIGIYISQNATTDRTLVFDLPVLVVQHLTGAATFPGAASEANPDEYAGTYLHNRRSFTRFEKLFAATSVAVVSPAESGGVIVAAQGETELYKPVAGVADVFQNRYGDRIVFGRNAQGAVTHVSDSAGVHSLERVGSFGNPKSLNIALGAAVFFSVTVWLGAWRRYGRSDNAAPAGRWLGLAGLGAAAACLAFTGVLVFVIIGLSSASAADLVDYPPFAVTLLRALSLVVFIAAALMLISQWVVWTRSGWGAARKAHYTLFAMALGALAVMLVNWNFVFAQTI
ncbi:MAG: serine hydrolase domain-containing protein [Hyphococcus sp.]